MPPKKRASLSRATDKNRNKAAAKAKAKAAAAAKSVADAEAEAGAEAAAVTTAAAEAETVAEAKAAAASVPLAKKDTKGIILTPTRRPIFSPNWEAENGTLFAQKLLVERLALDALGISRSAQ